eukprot:m.249102 g.249102  ORF g.249102 m.249102 type:complete len:50 (-) comp19514_c0_seq6:1987-2136(-)
MRLLLAPDNHLLWYTIRVPSDLAAAAKHFLFKKFSFTQAVRTTFIAILQ